MFLAVTRGLSRVSVNIVVIYITTVLSPVHIACLISRLMPVQWLGPFNGAIAVPSVTRCRCRCCRRCRRRRGHRCACRRLLKTTASIITKFCRVIEIPKYSLLVVQICPQNPRWRTAAILKNRKILISSQPIDRFWRNLAMAGCAIQPWADSTIKTLYNQNYFTNRN